MFKEGYYENKERPYVDIGVAFVVGGEAADEAKKISDLIESSAEMEYKLGGNMITHISLFQGRFPVGVETKIGGILASLKE